MLCMYFVLTIFVKFGNTIVTEMSAFEEQLSFKTPTKKERISTNYKLCLRCQKTDTDSLSVAQTESVIKFCNVAETRKDHVYERIKADIHALKTGSRKVLWHTEACCKRILIKKACPIRDYMQRLMMEQMMK